MASSVECCPKSIEASAGGLVWVRRGNGSWWPGQIIGQEELVESSTASLREGTPVKLIGREDASVDWYNLETSKQVKAFRCGEYNKCIEKAKAVAANNAKKVVKHTRREDAILRALELETASLTKNEENIGKESNGSEGCSTSDPELSEPNTVSAEEQLVQEGSQQNGTLLSDSDGGGGGGIAEGAKRMRGLNDLGTGVVQLLKRKRSQVAHVREFLKKKSRRRRRLMKVLESTAMVTNPVVSEGGVPSPNRPDCKVMEKASPSIPELPENGGVQTSLFDVPFIAGEKKSPGLSPVVSLASQKAEIGVGEKGSQSSEVGTMSLGINNGELIESGSKSLTNLEVSDVSKGIEKGTSKWQSKRKRNSRHIRQTKVCVSGKRTGVNGKSLACSKAFYTNCKSKTVEEFQMDEFQGWGWNISQVNEPKAEVSNPHKLRPYRQSRFTVNPKYESSDFSFLNHKAKLSPLYDVNLEVKSSYGRSQQVPYVSLTSKINGGRPITGHPLTVEVLDDGSCAQLLLMSASDCCDDLEGVNLSKRKSCSRKFKSKNSDLLSSKKMRKLSSLTGSRKQSQDKTKAKLVGPMIAWVPLKVVFSRINEALTSISSHGTSNG
ncbi:unnamed protein product [Cuscuta epithymum]|uniref:PWWP domain-containing protein n=1 Tax=Cuscuta epithymum TaxID=186058 RepID=A0AAV0BY08_9ASTE|nr:unnamed protein product [Cuscuta epithymum]